MKRRGQVTCETIATQKQLDFRFTPYLEISLLFWVFILNFFPPDGPGTELGDGEDRTENG